MGDNVRYVEKKDGQRYGSATHCCDSADGRIHGEGWAATIATLRRRMGRGMEAQRTAASRWRGMGDNDRCVEKKDG